MADVYRPLVGADPQLGLNRMKFDIAIDHVALILSSMSLLLTLLNMAYSIYRAYTKPTRLMILAAIFASILFVTEFTNFAWPLFAPNYLTFYFFSIGTALNPLFFLLAQTEMIRLVVPSTGLADLLIWRWSVAHIVIHFITATPLYIICPGILIGASDSYRTFTRYWNTLAPVWLFYVLVYDVCNSLWLSRKIYLFKQQVISISEESQFGDSAVAPNGGMMSGGMKSVGSLDNIKLNRSQSLNDLKSNQDDLVHAQPHSALHNLRTQYYRTLALIGFMIVCDILVIIFSIIFFTRVGYAFGSLDSRIGYMSGVISASFGGFHGVCASLFYGFLAEIFKAKRAPVLSPIRVTIMIGKKVTKQFNEKKLRGARGSNSSINQP